MQQLCRPPPKVASEFKYETRTIINKKSPLSTSAVWQKVLLLSLWCELQKIFQKVQKNPLLLTCRCCDFNRDSSDQNQESPKIHFKPSFPSFWSNPEKEKKEFSVNWKIWASNFICLSFVTEVSGWILADLSITIEATTLNLRNFRGRNLANLSAEIEATTLNDTKTGLSRVWKCLSCFVFRSYVNVCLAIKVTKTINIKHSKPAKLIRTSNVPNPTSFLP